MSLGNPRSGVPLMCTVFSLFAAVLTGCGGSSSSTTGPSGGSSGSLSSLEVEVVPDSSAQAPLGAIVARIAGLLGWPQVAEASDCSVTAGVNNVSAGLGADQKAKLFGVQLDATGHFPLTISCSDGTGGTLSLTGTPGHVVVLKVSVKRGEIKIKFKDEHA
jgi:hypothetical protein